jgi:hypothetical protein
MVRLADEMREEGGHSPRDVRGDQDRILPNRVALLLRLHSGTNPSPETPLSFMARRFIYVTVTKKMQDSMCESFHFKYVAYLVWAGEAYDKQRRFFPLYSELCVY